MVAVVARVVVDLRVVVGVRVVGDEDMATTCSCKKIAAKTKTNIRSEHLKLWHALGAESF